MKLPTITALASLFYTTTLATITLEDLPSEFKVGSTQTVKWTQDLDYQITDLFLTHEEDGGDSWSPMGSLNHKLNYTKGSHSVEWKVPAVKDKGYYNIWITGADVNDIGVPEQTGYADLSNRFKIVGGPTLYPKEIAGVVVGTLAGLALLIAAFVVGARCLRKRKSVAVDLSEGGERA